MTLKPPLPPTTIGSPTHPPAHSPTQPNMQFKYNALEDEVPVMVPPPVAAPQAFPAVS